uniref:Uncharacterized protein n=1 Tax=Micrurus lemniscatus lemniscatus TaxID=129467 RepID=A0A2D4H6Y2_MICLE
MYNLVHKQKPTNDHKKISFKWKNFQIIDKHKSLIRINLVGLSPESSEEKNAGLHVQKLIISIGVSTYFCILPEHFKFLSNTIFLGHLQTWNKSSKEFPIGRISVLSYIQTVCINTIF